MTSTLVRGLVAGLAGTTALNLVGYVDMARRGRPASDTPGEAVDELAGRLGTSVPGGRSERSARREGLGALLGIASGLSVGVAAALTRDTGLRPTGALGAVATGAAAMTATNLPMAVLGVSDPRSWSTTDWISDGIPHLAYGIAAQTALAATDDPGVPQRRPGAGLVARSALLGAATGCRSSYGAGVPALLHPDAPRRGLAGVVAVAAELVADKRPSTPSRLEAQGLGSRVASAATGSAMLARADGSHPLVPAAAGVVGSVVGARLGLAFRGWSARSRPDWQGALVEDAVGLALAVLVSWPVRRRAAPAAAPAA